MGFPVPVVFGTEESIRRAMEDIVHEALMGYMRGEENMIVIRKMPEHDGVDFNEVIKALKALERDGHQARLSGTDIEIKLRRQP